MEGGRIDVRAAMASKEIDMFAIVNRYVTNVRHQAEIRERIGKLHEEADGLLDQIEADARLIKTAMTLAGKPVVETRPYGPVLVLQGCSLKLCEMGYASGLPSPEPKAAEPDQVLADAQAALENAIEDCNAEAEADIAEAQGWAKIAATPVAEAVTA